MTKTAPIKVLAFTAASTVLAFTVACVDQTSPVRAVGLAARDAAGGDRMINTPFGPRPESTVHLLARGHAARINGQHVEEIDSKGTVVSEYGIGPASFGDSGGSPWITSDSLVLPSTDTLVHFETDVVVPAPPSNEYGSQYITVWEGLQKPGGPIVQPVLTWGYQGVTGEGNYWTVACWGRRQLKRSHLLLPTDRRQHRRYGAHVSRQQVERDRERDVHLQLLRRKRACRGGYHGFNVPRRAKDSRCCRSAGRLRHN